MSKKLKVGIVGVSGYGGGETARLIAEHPDAELTYVTSNTYAGQSLQKALPGASHRLHLTCENFDAHAAIEKCDVLFLAGENGLAMKIAPQLLEAGKKLIDLSADFRLKDVTAYRQWYKAEHTSPQLLEKAVYGMADLHADQIKGAQLVANPGCYPTSAALALAPLLSEKIIDPATIIIDSMSGVSGAGRSKFSLDYHFSEVNESARPYGVGGVHRHTPEIEQELAVAAEQAVTVTFTPHLAPITRGILTTAYASLSSSGDLASIHGLFKAFYKNSSFVTVLDMGEYPATKHVHGTNYCHIGLAVDQRTKRVIVTSVIDNLVKGAAGQAVQNMNLMCGLEETAGLTMGAVWP